MATKQVQQAAPAEPKLRLEPLSLSIPEAAKAAGISRSALYRQIQEGALRARKAGKRTLIPVAELHRWLAALPST